jgi:hypothetical protein
VCHHSNRSFVIIIAGEACRRRSDREKTNATCRHQALYRHRAPVCFGCPEPCEAINAQIRTSRSGTLIVVDKTYVVRLGCIFLNGGSSYRDLTVCSARDCYHCDDSANNTNGQLVASSRHNTGRLFLCWCSSVRQSSLRTNGPCNQHGWVQLVSLND